MRRVALIYNPSSGRQRARRSAQIEAALAVLRGAGVAAQAVETSAPGTAGQQAQQAICLGCDTVFACGGDGTVHEVLQGMVGSSAALGVVPLGTANALAVDLGLSGKPDEAVRSLLASEPVRVSVGRISYGKHDGETCFRYFTVAAGIGPDAHLMYRLNARLKARFGYLAYIAEALRLWATHTYPLFEAELGTCNNSSLRVEQVSQLLAVRISNFGGVLRNLAPGAALHHDSLRLVLFKTRSRFHYLRFVLGTLFGRDPRVAKVELSDAASVTCRRTDHSAAQIYVEADGEHLGSLPATIEVVPDALTLLMPHKSRA